MGLLVLMTGCVAIVVNLVRAPIGAANEFVALLDDGEIEAAYGSLCIATRQSLSLDQFTQDVAVDGEITAYTLLSTSMATGRQTTVSGTIEIDEEPRNISFGLAKEGQTWRVCSYDLLG